MAFPDAFLERLRNYYLLSDYIGKFIPLKRHGREYMGLCPFHKEKSPSFTVNNEKGFFHCFGCKAHGDAIGFLQKYEGIGWKEAVEKLAREAGMELPDLTPRERQRIRVEKTLTGVLEEAASWFEMQLKRAENLEPRHYLEQRGLSTETLSRFRLGYAPDSRDALKQHLLKNGYSDEQALRAGLVIKPDNGSTYDRFRGRLMFPIRSPRGQVVAFGGRLIEGAAPSHGYAPKYLNSPETELFHKGQMLYNLDLAGRPARDKSEILITEGYMDTIALAQAGFTHSVATLGTAVTADHLKRLWQYAPEPVLCLDGDNAGKRAMLRTAELALPLLTPGYSLRFALLPGGEDPDSLIQKRGSAAFGRVIQQAGTLSEMLWRHFSADTAQTPEAMAALEHKLDTLVKRIEHPTVRSHMQSYFRRQLWQKQKSASFTSGKRRDKTATSAPTSMSEQAIDNRKYELLLGILLRQPALLHEAEIEEYFMQLTPDHPDIAALHRAMAAAGHSTETDSREALEACLQEKGLKAICDHVLQNTQSLLPRAVSQSPAQARQAWTRIVAADEQLALEKEYHQLQQRIATDMTEENLARLMELQNLIKDMKKKRIFASEDQFA